MSPRSKPYSYVDVADRIEAVLGVRPALSTLRAAPSAAAHGTNRRVRITAGMPAPLDSSPPRQPLFSAAQIERWLASHPQLRRRSALARLAAAAPTDRPTAVRKARHAGLSWAEIAGVFAGVDDRPRTRQWAQQTYGATSPRADPERRRPR